MSWVMSLNVFQCNNLKQFYFQKHETELWKNMSAKKGSFQPEVMPWKDFISIYEKISFWLIIGFGSDKLASH